MALGINLLRSAPGRACGGLVAALAALALTASCAAAADAYKPDDFLTLDLAKAILSPIPLGPPSHFEPYSVEASTDARTEPKVEPAVTAKVDAAPGISAETPAPTEPARRPARATRPARPALARAAPGHTQYAQHRRNPLDAQASLPRPRIQTWPCNAGGICAWRNVTR